MKKSDLVKIGAIIVVIIFILEMFGFGNNYMNLFRSSAPASANMTGTAVINGTVRTYDPNLYVQGALPQPVIDQLNTMKDIRGIQVNSGITSISLDSRDSVYPVAVYLRTMNVTSFAIANLVIDQQVEFATLSGNVEVYLPNSVLQVTMQPLVDVDTDVPVQLDAVLQNSQVIAYQNIELLVKDVNITVDATVDSLNQTTYAYTIPWGERDSLGNLSAYQDMDYQKVDSVVFTTPLTVDQIVSRKALLFVVYIDANSAQLDPSFDNISLLNQSFQGIAYTLPPSALTIVSNATPDIPYTPVVTYTYGLLLSNDSYSFPQNSVSIDSSTTYRIGSDVNLSMEALTLGNRVIEIKRAFLPS